MALEAALYITSGLIRVGGYASMIGMLSSKGRMTDIVTAIVVLFAALGFRHVMWLSAYLLLDVPMPLVSPSMMMMVLIETGAVSFTTWRLWRLRRA